MKGLLMVFGLLTLVSIAHSTAAAEGDMAGMSATMQRIQATEDPEERERLLEEHLDQMHAEMKAMYRQMGQMMEQMEAQQTETKRLHDHRKTKNR